MTRITKIVLGLLIIVILALVGAGVYWYLANSGTGAGGNTRSFLFFPGGGGAVGGGETSGGGEPLTGDSGGKTQSRLMQIVKEPVIGAVLNKDETKVLYYKRAGGNLFQANLDGQNEENKSNLTIIGLTDVRWSPSRERAVLGYIDDGVLRYLIENVATSSTVFLPQRVTSASWQPETGALIAYTEITENGLRIVTANAQLKNQQTLFTSPIPEYTVSWVDKTNLVALTRPTYFATSLSQIISTSKKSSEFVPVRGLGVLPSPNGGLLAIGGVDANGALLPIRFVDIKGREAGSSNVRTLVEKCAWRPDGAELICAAPKNNAGSLPDSWQKGIVSFEDMLVKIDSRTGIAVDLPGTEGGLFDATGIFLDSQNKYLFFTNKRDSTLWRLELAAE